MKTIFKLTLATVIALGVVSCEKEDPRLSEGYFEITSQSVIEVENNYKGGKLEFTLPSGYTERIGYLVSDYMVVRCKTFNCMYYVNGTMYASSNRFYPPDWVKR